MADSSPKFARLYHTKEVPSNPCHDFFTRTGKNVYFLFTPKQHFSAPNGYNKIVPNKRSRSVWVRTLPSSKNTPQNAKRNRETCSFLRLFYSPALSCFTKYADAFNLSRPSNKDQSTDLPPLSAGAGDPPNRCRNQHRPD